MHTLHTHTHTHTLTRKRGHRERRSKGRAVLVECRMGNEDYSACSKHDALREKGDFDSSDLFVSLSLSLFLPLSLSLSQCGRDAETGRDSENDSLI